MGYQIKGMNIPAELDKALRELDSALESGSDFTVELDLSRKTVVIDYDGLNLTVKINSRRIESHSGDTGTYITTVDIHRAMADVSDALREL